MRAILLLGIAAFFVAGLAWLARDPAGVETREPGSTFETAPGGASLAFAYLGERAGGAPVRRLTGPLRASEIEADAVVFRLRPRGHALAAPAGGAARREVEWIRGGGRLVLALAEAWAGVGIEPGRSGGAVRKVHPLLAGVAVLQPSSDRVLAGPEAERAVALFARGDSPVVARAPLGRGDVVLLSAPEVLENERLPAADHLRLLEALAGAGRPVYFDERVHGVDRDRGTFELLLGWNLGPALLLLAVSGLTILWRGRTRVGPPDEPAEDSRTDAVDLVDSLAQLYDRALRRDEAAGLYHSALRRAVSLRTGLKGRALDERVRRLTGGLAPPRRSGKKDMAAREFHDALGRINRAFGGLSHGHSR